MKLGNTNDDPCQLLNIPSHTGKENALTASMDISIRSSSNTVYKKAFEVIQQ